MSETTDWTCFLFNIELMIEHEGSPEKLAVKTNVPFFTIYNWRFRKQRPRIESLRLIADAYDITLDDLIDRQLKKSDLS